MNCLAHCLEQWEDNPDLVIWYNSNHVVIIEEGLDLEPLGYLTLDKFGFDHFCSSFKLSKEYTELLEQYFISL